MVRLETCELCGADCPDTITSRARAHHWRGYDYPLDVWFLCHRCNCLLKGDRFHNGSISKEEAWQFIKSKLFPTKPTITRCEAYLITGLRCKNKVTNGQFCHLHRSTTKDLRANIEQLAGEQGKTEIEIITALQAAAARTGDEKLLNQLCLLKRKYIKF